MTLFVADYGNNRIRKITSDGVVSTIAGSTEGFADGQGSQAMFYSPGYLAVRPDGTILVSDGRNGRIRIVTPDGTVSTLVSNLMAPMGLAISKSGVIYISESHAHRIIKMSPDGERSVYSGSEQGSSDGPLNAARFSYPSALALAPDGTLFVVDSGNHRIRAISPNGIVRTIAGSWQGFQDGLDTDARFHEPRGIALGPNGTLYVSDFYNHRIREISSSGMVSTLCGMTEGYADARGSEARFSFPAGLAISQNGTLFVADWRNHRIRVVR
jgi:sugar lactone lactonase YvrE